MDDITVVLHKCPFVDASCAVSMQVFFYSFRVTVKIGRVRIRVSAWITVMAGMPTLEYGYMGYPCRRSEYWYGKNARTATGRWVQVVHTIYAA